MSSSRSFSDGRRQEKAPEKSNFVQTCNLLSQYIKEKGSLRDLNLEIGGKVESLETIVKPGSSLAASDSTAMNSQAKTGKSSIIVVEDASNKASTSKESTTMDPKSSQLTIFYSGRVLIFDDYPVDKVRELVSMAKKSSSQMSYGILLNNIQEKPSPVVVSTSNAREGLPPRPQPGNGKQPIGVSSNTCKEKTSSTMGNAGGAVASSSNAQEQLSPSMESNGSDLPIARRSSLHRFLEKRKDRAGARGPYQNQEQPQASSSKGDEQLDLNI